MTVQEIIIDLIDGADYAMGEVAADVQAHFPAMSWAEAVTSTRKEITALARQGRIRIYREIRFNPRKIEPVAAAEVERMLADDNRWISSNEYWVGRI